MNSEVPRLTSGERFDSWMSRALPRLGPRLHRRAYRVSGGRIGAAKRGIPVGMLTTTGRRSGTPRTTPVMCMDEGWRVLVVASNAGFDAPPAWLLNLASDPEATLELAGQANPVRARVLEAAEREERWPRLLAHNPLYGDFQSRTSREIVVVALERQR